ncbi:GDP-mannose 4,6-dehydratase [Patescibacteria group bacterium]|nr:GDP-mannose 4,6-dehydratase [Patescibacteria group bacterium]
MKILLTGAAGFIGSHASKALLERGDTVIGIDNFNDYYSVAQKEENAANLKKYENFTLVRTDICNSEKMNEIFNREKPDILIHLAARAGVRPSIEDPELYFKVNIEGTVNLLEAARKSGTKQIVFASSSSVYGEQKKVPFSEDDPTENPISPYAATKRGAENICYMYSTVYGLKITCLRFFTVYGPAGRPDMAPFLFTKWIDEGTPVKRFGDGGTSRDYTFVDDIVQGILAAADNPFNFEIINLGNNHPEKLSTLIETIENALNKKAIINELPMQPGDVTKTYADIEKVRRLLSYEPKTSLTDGIRSFINWYKK